jgi:hypothetical protein
MTCCLFQLVPNRQLTHRTVRTQDFPDFWVLGGLRANRTLLSSVWAAAAVPASVLTAARKLKYSWILARISGLIQIARRTRLDKGVFMRQPGTVNPPD